MSTGVELIAAERKRQVEKEGWTPDHDEQHTEGELAWAACYYAMPETLCKQLYMGTGVSASITIDPRFFFPPPWSFEWRKREDQDRISIRDLVKAGALIAAEIDRRIRREEEA